MTVEGRCVESLPVDFPVYDDDEPYNKGKATMCDKPSYLGLLNAIAVGEARGYQLLSA